MAEAAPIKRVRIHHLREFKRSHTPITMLTAYDAITAAILDQAGTDLLLVGDSIGNTYFGYDTTLPVELDEMVVATRSVVRGVQRALVVADLPFGSYEASNELAVASAVRLMKARADAVKLEGGARSAERIRAIVNAGIPVVGHVGYTPQAEHSLGGPRVQGRTDDAAQKVIDDAVAVAEAGASAVVLEMVPASVSQRITEILRIPTIGIGAGPKCDGQVLVWTDMAGMQNWHPKFARVFGQVGKELFSAAAAFNEAVRGGQFPAEEHSF